MQKPLMILFVLLAITLTAKAQAQVTFDNGGADNLWTTPNNWSTNTLPSSTDEVIIDNDFKVTLISGNQSVDELDVGETGNGQLSLTGTSTLDTTNDLLVGNSGSSNGNLILNDSSNIEVGSLLVIANSGNATGTMTMNNSSTLDFTDGDLIIGGIGNTTASLTLNDNATIDIPDTGSGGSLVLGEGGSAIGTLIMNGNSDINVQEELFLGNQSTAQGILVMNGNSRLFVEDAGVVGGVDDSSGQLTINNRAFLDVGILVVGSDDDATGTVTLNNNARIYNDQNAFIGFDGDATGSLIMNDRSTMEVKLILYVGTTNDSRGFIRLNNNSALTISQVLVLGNEVSAEGNLVMNDDSFVQTADDLSIGNTNNAKGFVTLNDNASISVGDDLNMAETNSAQGTLTMNDSSIINVQEDMNVAIAVSGIATVTMNANTLITVGDDLNIGQINDSNGTVTLNGNARIIIADDLDIARQDNATGTLTLNDNASITVSDLTSLGILGSDNGTLNMNGGQLTTGDFSVAENNVVNLADGKITVNGTVTAFNAATINWTGGTLQTNNFTFTTATETLVVPDTATLIINGNSTFTGTLEIANGATFTVSPDEATTITIDQGPLTLQSGSSTNVDIGNNGIDQIIVQGTATNASVAGSLTINVDTISMAIGETFTLIDNNSSSTVGTFDSFSDNLPRIIFTGAVSGSDYVITATLGSSFEDIANSNEKDLARVLDNAGSGSNFQSAINNLNARSETDIQRALRDLSGQSTLSTLNTTLANARMLNQNLIQYLTFHSGHPNSRFTNNAFSTNVQNSLMGKLAADTHDHALVYQAYLQSQESQDSYWNTDAQSQSRTMNDLRVSGDWNLWANVVGGFFSRDTTTNTDGFESYMTGIQAGVDFSFTDDLLLGISLAYTYGHTSMFDSRGEVQTHSIRIGPYLAYELNGFYLNAGLTAGFHFQNGERNITAFAANAHREYNAFDISSFAHVGYNIQINNFILGPVAGLEYTYLYEEQFTENNAGVYNLSVAERDLHSLRVLLGIRLGAMFELGEVFLMPELQLGWTYELLNNSESVDAVFSSSPGSNFSFNTAAPERHSAAIQAGLTMKINESLSAFVKYSGEFNLVDRQNVGTIGLRWRF